MFFLTQNFRDILTRRKCNSPMKFFERYSNGKRYSPRTAGRFLTRSVRKNEISSETHEKTRKRQRRGCTGERDAAVLRFHIPRGFIVGKNVFTGVATASWRKPWSDYISCARYISEEKAVRKTRRPRRWWILPASEETYTDVFYLHPVNACTLHIRTRW